LTAEELTSALGGTDVEATMTSLGFTTEFVAKNVMSVDGPITVSQVAMLWMGMPNKHDRKRTRQLLDALTTAGLLTNTAEDTYTKP
jgi:hypothetical protein